MKEKPLSCHLGNCHFPGNLGKCRRTDQQSRVSHQEKGSNQILTSTAGMGWYGPLTDLVVEVGDGVHEGLFSRDLLLVFSAGGPCEQF